MIEEIACRLWLQPDKVSTFGQVKLPSKAKLPLGRYENPLPFEYNGKSATAALPLQGGLKTSWGNYDNKHTLGGIAISVGGGTKSSNTLCVTKLEYIQCAIHLYTTMYRVI